MSSNNSIPLLVIGSEVRTACGSEKKLAFDTPWAIYEDKWVFFCTPLCQQEFIQDPGSSCLSDQIQDLAS